MHLLSHAVKLFFDVCCRSNKILGQKNLLAAFEEFCPYPPHNFHNQLEDHRECCAERHIPLHILRTRICIQALHYILQQVSKGQLCLLWNHTIATSFEFFIALQSAISNPAFRHAHHPFGK